MNTVLNTENIDNRLEPLFLGKPLSLQRYDQLKYPKIFELAKEMEKFYWQADEIDLTKDRNDYLELSESERFVFDTNLKWQTMTDSMLSRSISTISGYVSNNELEKAMGVWQFFESNIHSDSYSHILKNVYVDESIFWNSILTDKEINARAHEIKKAYDAFFGNPTDIKQTIFDALLSTQITEGLSFYVSFACSYFFAARGKMEGNGKIIKLIARDENLHVALTQNVLGAFRDVPSEGFQHIVKANKQRVYDAYGLAVEQEARSTDYMFSRGSLLGLNADIVKGYTQWLANNRLQSQGYDKIFDIKKNPIGNWLDQYTNSKKVQSAPQETELTSYTMGSRDTQVDYSQLCEIEL